MTAIAERSMPIVDVYWDEARARWTFEDQFGCCPVEAVDEASATRLVAAHFPGSSIRWIRGSAPSPSSDPAVAAGEPNGGLSEAPFTSGDSGVLGTAVPPAAVPPDSNSGPVPSEP